MSDFFASMQLKAAGARTVSGAFQQFMTEQINIVAGTRSRASGSQTNLRDYLRDLRTTDLGFPRILRDADTDFLGGSFARHTKIWPLDDIDVFFPIDGTGLFYSKGGFRAPYTVLSDEVLDENPLCTDRERWWEGSYISSEKLIDGFAKSLRKNYPTTTRVRRGGEAVTVTLTNGLGFDVVPCFSLQPFNSWGNAFYLIPDGNDGWIQTNPRLDQEMSERIHAANNRTLRKAVKLVKWWTNEFVGGRLESYYTELAIMRAFEAQNYLGRIISTVPWAAFVGFEAVRDTLQRGDQRSNLEGSPMVEPGDVTARDIELLQKAVNDAGMAMLYENADKTDDALDMWGNVFGDKFPTR